MKNILMKNNNLIMYILKYLFLKNLVYIMNVPTKKIQRPQIYTRIKLNYKYIP